MLVQTWSMWPRTAQRLMCQPNQRQSSSLRRFMAACGTGLSAAPLATFNGFKYDPFGAVCQIVSWDLEITREELDAWGRIQCGVGGKLPPACVTAIAAFMKFQPGYASGTGSMTVLFTDNDDALGQRMLDNVMLSSGRWRPCPVVRQYGWR